ncbi:hypothetical protein ACFVW2_24660 [Streptomyces sp. NPDC058171]
MTATRRIDVARLRHLGRVASGFVEATHPAGIAGIAADPRRSER